jgi:LacI family transcriptional regulator
VYIGPKSGIHIFEDRFKGYLNALRENNIKIRKKLILKTERTFNSSNSTLTNSIRKGLKFDGIVCAGGLVAFGAGNAILQNKLNIPDDILLGEFGDNNIISRLGVPFHTVNQNPYRLGSEAVEILSKMIDKGKLSSKIIHKNVKHNIIFRNPGSQRSLLVK